MWNYSSSLNLEDLNSETKPVLFIKHSNRCSISSMALNRLLEHKPTLDETYNVFLIDVVKDRSLSQEIANYYNVQHQSPQVIVVKNREPVYDSSHLAIQARELLQL